MRFCREITYRASAPLAGPCTALMILSHEAAAPDLSALAHPQVVQLAGHGSDAILRSRLGALRGLQGPR